MKIPHVPYRVQDYTGGGIIGSYKVSPYEKKQILAENAKRGLLHLVIERNQEGGRTPKTPDIQIYKP